MSGRGGGRGFGRGGRGGRGGGAGPAVPVARDEDGTVLPTAPAGPPPLFPEIELPEYPDIAPKDKMLLLRRFELAHRFKSSPYRLELPKAQQETGLPEEGFDPFKHLGQLQQPAAAPHSAPADGVGTSGGAAGAAASAAPVAASATAPRAGAKRSRPPLSSVMTLMGDYFPDELYSSKDMRASRLQTLKGQDAYFRSQSRPDDATGLRRLEQLAKLESTAEEGGGAGGPGRKPGEGEDDDAPPEEDALHDTDEEEDMAYDDYYQGEHFDDDEGYGDALDEGGDEGPVY